MFDFFSGFLKDVIKDGLTYLMDTLSGKLLDLVLNPTASMDGIDLSSVNSSIQGIAISYCCFKFAKKLFSIYVLWTDGDSENPPHILVINFIKSLALILTFSSVYEYFIKVIQDVGTVIYESIKTIPEGENPVEKLLPEDQSFGFFFLLVILIGIVIYLITWFSCMKSGVLLLVLKIGFPFVASGVMDTNGGMFASYLPKFLQMAFTVIVKVSLLKLGLLLLLTGNPLWAIVALSAGAAVAEMLKEFMLVTSGGGFGGRLSSMAMLLGNLRRMGK